jgi:prephenate dehydrogenase
VCGFWRTLGARVVVRDPAAHDAEVAWISHLPHALAFAFARALGAAPSGAHEVAGSGFRDFTRIAHSDPELWAEILTSNRKAIAAPLEAAGAALAELHRAIEANDAEAVQHWIASARSNLAGARRSRPAADTRSPRPSPDSRRGRRIDEHT